MNLSANPAPNPFFSRLTLFLMIWGGCYLLTILALHGMMLAVFGKETYKQLTEGAMPDAIIPAMRFFQMFSSIGSFALPVVLFIVMQRLRWDFLKLNTSPKLALVALAPVIVFLSFPVIAWSLELNKDMRFPPVFEQLETALRQSETRSEAFLHKILAADSAAIFALNFLMLAILPALTEELLFRGVLQQLLDEAFQNIHIAILFTGAIFSFIHFQFFGFLPRMLMGVLLGYLFYFSKNLWLPILAHFVHNGVQVALVFLFQSGRISYNIDEQEKLSPYMTMGATVLLIVSVYIFDRVSQRQKTP